MIQTDCKIWSKILANRIDKVINDLAQHDQVGFIQKRNSSDNMRRMLNIMWAVCNSGSPIAAKSLGAEKHSIELNGSTCFVYLKPLGLGRCSWNGSKFYTNNLKQQHRQMGWFRRQAIRPHTEKKKVGGMGNNHVCAKKNYNCRWTERAWDSQNCYFIILHLVCNILPSGLSHQKEPLSGQVLNRMYACLSACLPRIYGKRWPRYIK